MGLAAVSFGVCKAGGIVVHAVACFFNFGKCCCTVVTLRNEHSLLSTWLWEGVFCMGHSPC